MRFAYADPPYPGRARKHYRDHADYAGEVDHAALIGELERDFDAWALSTSPDALQDVLPLCPAPIPRGAIGGGVKRQFRVLSWGKYVGQPDGGGGPFHCWEPVILRGGRRDRAPQSYPRDWIVVSPELYTMRPKPEGHVTGAKPPIFCRWLFACAGLEPGDELVDLFPGSGAVAEEWAAWSSQPHLVPPGERSHRDTLADLRRDHPALPLDDVVAAGG